MAEKKPNSSAEEELSREERKRRAYERLAADQQFIESLNWKNENGRNALHMLPPELWITIFQYIQNPEDLQNVWDTCPQFADILERRKACEVLLPKALRLLGVDQ